MEAYFFESHKHKLFGIYHSPKSDKYTGTGILLCNPFAQEQIRCHKLYLSLADELSREGFHVLRFDYYGTGDSEGSKSDFRIATALDDIQSTVSEFKEGCELNSIFLLGGRFGATLSMLYAQDNNIDGMVLWKPLLSGKQYINEIKGNYKKWLNGSFAKQKIRHKSGLDMDGFTWSKELIVEISNINIDKITDKKALILSNEIAPLKAKLDCHNPDNVTFFESTKDKFWVKQDDVDENTLVPKQELEVIKQWLINNYQ